MRAYAGTAAECLREAPKEPLIDRIKLSFHCPFSLIGLLQSRLPEWGVEADTPEFDALGAQFILTLPTDWQENITQRITDLTNGQAQIRLVEEN